MEKTIENSTQDYPSVRHKREAMPMKLDVVRFPGLYDPLRSICHNKVNVSVDFLENTHAGKKRWGLVLYGMKSKLLS